VRPQRLGDEEKCRSSAKNKTLHHQEGLCREAGLAAGHSTLHLPKMLVVANLETQATTLNLETQATTLNGAPRRLTRDGAQ
jgi:hypothetical protein